MESFTPWHPLTADEVEASAPDRPCALQLRVDAGLLDYPEGRSAMALYLHADRSGRDTLRRELSDELEAPGARGLGRLRFRWLEPSDGDPASSRAFLEEQLDRFRRRFGAAPRLQPEGGLP